MAVNGENSLGIFLLLLAMVGGGWRCAFFNCIHAVAANHDCCKRKAVNGFAVYDDIYSAVIMTEVIARVHSVHLVNAEQITM